ncbi:MAG: BtrH N-terminal domain-containing protein [Anaerolineae bacterium]|nr:BtrH N-terminal domain-containing protein [Anaerolineae bacterium]
MSPLQPFTGFKSLQTHHCVTGSMRHIYAFNGCDVSEDLLLGLGEGVGFMYWQAKGQPPFLGGRTSPKPSMEAVAGERTGVQIESHTTASAPKARQAMLNLLEAGQPAMIQVDMGFLPYFDFGGEEYHFGGHVVVACGYDPDAGQVLIAERDNLYPVSLPDLEKARGSTFKPFPPKNGWTTFDFQGFHPPSADETRRAITNQASQMLKPPIRNLGVAGIRTAAERIPHWPDQVSTDDIRRALFSAYIFINAVGGTGGGCFRYMFSRFLGEAADITGEARLAESAAEFKRIGDAWEVFADWAKEASESPDPAGRLSEAVTPLQAIADQEQAAWETLQHRVR